ncbi:hypothetical protein L3X38_013466 [Prunus dulcis]|uniref:Leucine-rich repeat-containing N-terminal plant-type domain-containing protein n=1 Tax=Prunus dulcis TaxID=3755 RepID=A0AAD4WMY6_PRUDU|nr:hypothetical protein L3X38_013466 [Prunus dulcis]
MEALLAFKQGLVDDDNSLLSWGREVQNKDCCQWAGVYCSNHTGHVVKLDLGYESLQAKEASPQITTLSKARGVPHRKTTRDGDSPSPIKEDYSFLRRGLALEYSLFWIHL